MAIQVRSSGPTTASIMLVGEAPGEQETLHGEPFVGASGMELSRMLSEAGINRSECFITNVVRERPPGNDISAFIPDRKKDVTSAHVSLRDRMVLPCVREGVDLLRREINLVKPRLIIAFGNVALWTLTGKWGITDWRGSILECDLEWVETTVKVIPAYHPAAVLRQWAWRPVLVHDLRRAKKESATFGIAKPGYNFILRPSFEVAWREISLLTARGGKVSVDIETRGGHIACVGLAWSKLDAICIPLMCVENPRGYWNEEEEAVLCFGLYRLLTSPGVQVIWQNGLYDAQYFYRHLHFIPNHCRDTMIAQHTMFSNMPKGLDYLSSMYCEYHTYWKGESKNWDAKLGEDQLWAYNCKDAVITFEVDEAQQVAIDQMNLRAPHDFQQRLFNPVLHSMNEGLRVDKSRRAEFAMTLSSEISVREEWFKSVLGHPLNPKSPAQMKKLFYDDLGQRPIINRMTGKPTLNDEALTKLGEREPILRPFLRKIAEYRTLGVFMSTFVSAALDSDDRIRCSFNIAGTKSYRFSSSQNAFDSGMNLQNLSTGGEFGEESELDLPNVKTIFTPPPGYSYFDIDLDSADLRIVVWESNCLEMKAMLAAGLSVYVEIAKEYYHDQSITKKHPKYREFKSLCHGTNYLGSAKGIAPRIGLLVHECDRIQRWYYGKFPEIHKWQEDFKSRVASRRYVENAFGYRCYVFDRLEGNLINELIAWLPQSTIACLINRGYLNLYEQHRNSVEVLLQVHDSLAGIFPTHLGDWAIEQIRKACMVPVPYADPLIIPVSVKRSSVSWGDCL